MDIYDKDEELRKCKDFLLAVKKDLAHVEGSARQSELVLRLNSMFPPDYEFYKSDAEPLWCLSDYGSTTELLDETFLHFSLIDHFTGIPMYTLNKTSVHNFLKTLPFLFSNPNPMYSGYGYNFQVNFPFLFSSPNLDEYVKIDDVNSCIPKTTRHVSVRGSIASSFLTTLYEIQELQTLLILRSDGLRLDSLPHDFFQKLPSLQALDLSHTDITELPSFARNVSQLRYLNLSFTPIVELPNSLCNILTLETLKLRGCLKPRSLPKAIRRLTSLKHLDVDVSCLLVSMPPGVGDLCQLKTLPAFVVGKQYGWHINELKTLNNLSPDLRILRLENLSSPEQAKDAALHEKNLKKLEFHWSRPEDGLEILESLCPSWNIEELQIIGYGGAKFPGWIEDCMFTRLKTITIHNCNKSVVLPSLGKLRCLMFLNISDMIEVKLIDEKFCGTDLTDHEYFHNAFPMLETLTFHGMPELHQWIGVGKYDFPCLQKLKISNCSKLKILPELSLLRSLQQLEISLCHSLEFFSNGGLPVSLQSIVIIECPKLKERCHKDVGEEWDKLTHIPYVWIDYQQLPEVEETPEARDLGTSEDVIASNFDNRLSTVSSLLGDGDGGGGDVGRRQTNEQFEAAEKIVLRWHSMAGSPQHHSLLWEESPEQTAEYLSAVDEILQLTELLSLSHPDEGDIKDRVGSVLQLAMLRLKDDFRHILIQYMIPLDAGRFHGLSTIQFVPTLRYSFSSSPMSSVSPSSALTDENIDDFGSVDEDDSFSSCYDRELSLGYDVSVDLIHPNAVGVLKEIADRMIRSGYEKVCCQVYSSVRRDVLDECLSILGIEKMSTEEVLRLEWISLNEKINKWILAVRVVVTMLLSGEKYLCGQIFQGSEMIREICFTETAKGCVIQLLKFGKAIITTKWSIEKLFRILDMCEALAGVLPGLQELFSDDAGEFVASEVNTILKGLRDAAKGIYAIFENAVQSETSWKPIQGGAIHPLTRYVMSYVMLLVDYSDTLNPLLESSTDCPDHVETDEDILHLAIGSPLGQRLPLFLSSLESNLEVKSKHYEDAALQYIFLANNILYIVHKVEDSDLRKFLGERWVSKQRRRVQQYAIGYLRASWSNTLSYLKDEGIFSSGSSIVSKTILKERFNNFNLCFEKIYRTQTQWKVPDPQLREELKISVSERVLPACRSFLGRWGSHLESGRHAGKYIKYTRDDLENHLFDLFEGAPGRFLHNPN